MSHPLDLMITTLRSYGIVAGDCVAANLPNCQLLIDLIFAAWEIGANICPLNTRLPAAQIESHLNRLTPKLYVTEFGFFSRKGITSQIYSSVFLFTSGSTGTPKIALLSKENLLANAQGALELLDLRPRDRWLLSLPLFHVGGLGILLRCHLAKATAVLDTSDPDITHLSFVPTQLYRATPVYKKLRCLLLGGAAAGKTPSHLPIYSTYGLTEMGSMVTAGITATSLGHPLPNREIKLAPDGEILVRGSCLFQGYWENGALSLPLQNSWFPTKDLGIYSPLDGLTLIGRKDWQFISGGENIQPEEIERALLTCPEVIEATVVPRTDPEFGNRPVAFVRTSTGGFTFEKMRGVLLDLLPKYKIPVALHIVEEFPRKGLKIDRGKLFLF